MSLKEFEEDETPAAGREYLRCVYAGVVRYGSVDSRAQLTIKKGFVCGWRVLQTFVEFKKQTDVWTLEVDLVDKAVRFSAV